MKANVNGPGHITKMARWQPLLYIVKTIINLLLQNQKAMDFETWPEASMNTALQSLYKACPWDGLDLFYGKVRFGCISQFSGERLQGHWSSCSKTGLT